MAITLDLIVDLKTFLEGSFNGTDMNTDINDMVSLVQPYNTSPWNYTGTENVVFVPYTNIVDWVLVELRDASDPTSSGPSTISGLFREMPLHNQEVFTPMILQQVVSRPLANNPPQKEIATEVYGMYGGDLNANGNIGPGDKTIWSAEAGTHSYTSADANLDGETYNNDKNDITLQYVGEGSYVPKLRRYTACLSLLDIYKAKLINSRIIGLVLYPAK